MLKMQQPVRATEEAVKPAGCVTAGRAKMPAPTAVPATRDAAPRTLPGSCFRVVGFTLLKSLCCGLLFDEAVTGRGRRCR